MGYKELVRDVASFGKEVQADLQAIKAKREENQERISSEDLTVKQSDEIIQNMQQQLKDKQVRKAESLKQYADTLYNASMNQLNAKNRPVNSEMVAELSILSQLEVTQEDINEFAEKYSDVPLALRQVKELASKNKLDFTPPYNKADDLDLFNQKLNENIEVFSDNNSLVNDTTLNFIVMGIDETMQTDYSNYLNGSDNVL